MSEVTDHSEAVDTTDHQWYAAPMPEDHDLEIGTEYAIGDEMANAVCIDETNEVDSSKRSLHHVGPVPEDFIRDKRARQRALSKRLKGFEEKARLLQSMCGAEVTFKVVTETGRVIEKSFPTRLKRNVKIQVGESAFEGEKASTRASTGTPTKRPVLMPSSQTKVIKNLPGKKTPKSSIISKDRVKNKCSVCDIIYRSKKDISLSKSLKLQATWIGCDEDECQFWAHASCANIKIKSRKDIPTLKFVCNRH